MKLGTLHYKHGEGEVRLAPSIDLTKPDVVTLDILGDWIALLTIAYDDLYKITFPEGEKK